MTTSVLHLPKGLRMTLSLLLGALPLLAACTDTAVEVEPESTPRAALPTPTNILLITIDTLRADHLSAYGYHRPTSPVIDQLAAEGVRFDRPAVQWPKTGPSFASIFTSTYPKDNGIVRQIGIPVPLEYQMLAETLSEHGYSTGAVVANGAVATDFNFDQGFSRYVETWKIEDEGDPNRAERVTDEALAMSRGLPEDQPYFLWVHYLDPHFPYSPPEGFADRFVGDEHYDPTTKITIDTTSRRKQMVGIGYEMVLENQDELAFYEARYDEEILYADSEIGRLLDDLRQAGRLDNTLIVVTADHGESLGEHHYFFDHGRFSFQTCVRVPLIFHHPEVIPAGVDRAPTELIDLGPTLLEFAGVDLPEGRWMQGTSLVPRLLGSDDSEAGHLAFSEAGYADKGKWQRVVQDERYKLIFARQGNAQMFIGGMGNEWALYDLLEDPGELQNLADSLPNETRRLQKELASWLNAEPFPLGGPAPPGQGEMADETRRQLEALGYLQ